MNDQQGITCTGLSQGTNLLVCFKFTLVLSMKVNLLIAMSNDNPNKGLPHITNKYFPPTSWGKNECLNVKEQGKGDSPKHENKQRRNISRFYHAQLNHENFQRQQ